MAKALVDFKVEGSAQTELLESRNNTLQAPLVPPAARPRHDAPRTRATAKRGTRGPRNVCPAPDTLGEEMSASGPL